MIFSSQFLLVLVLNFLIQLANSQSQLGKIIETQKFVKPIDCNRQTEYFDTASLKCLQCPTNSAPSDLYNCRCNKDYYSERNNGGGKILCIKCDPGLIQSLDGFTCVRCDQTCQNCPAGSYRSDTDVDGSYYPNFVSRCIKCNNVFSLASKNSCTSCKPLIFPNSATTNIRFSSCTQFNNGNTIGGMLIESTPMPNFVSLTDPNEFNVNFGTTIVLSCYHSDNLLTIYKLCQDSARRNVSACQTLANLCVLNLYSSISNKIDACKAFYQIQNYNSDRPNSIQNSIQQGLDMPWIKYTDVYGSLLNSYASLGTYDTNGKYIRLSYVNKCEASPSLYFVASQYLLNGTLTKFDQVDISKFQLCNYLSTSYSKASQVSPFSATNFYQNCQISVESLIEFGSNLVFYDLFIKYNNQSGIFPIPVIVLNYKDQSNNEVNRNTNKNDATVVRRFFLVDSITGKQKDSTPSTANTGDSKNCLDNNPKFVRYAKSIQLRFDLLPESSLSGTIYPPTLLIDYDYVSADDLDKKVSVSFEIVYYMNLDTQNLAVYISIGILSFFSFVWAFIRIWIWNRRSGKLAPDMISLFKFAMFFCSSIANSFFLVTIGVSLYWLIFFKGQNVAFVVIPQLDQENIFRVFLIVAFVLKFFDIIHLILTQTSYDIFFIDWERPRQDLAGGTSSNNSLFPPLKKNEKTNKNEQKEQLIKDDNSEYNKISCWRTLFVANEWNEIQTFRKINPTIQLIFVLFFLKVVNLEAFTTSDCNASIVRDPNRYQAAYSSILRVGMAVSMYLGVALFQYLIYIFIYIRCFEDKIGQFVDFCSMANISMFIMTHSQFGYYIHGRSPHGNADTSMQKMTEALLNEENNLTAKRGLEKDSDQQTFSISISDKLSRQYSKVMIPIYERKAQRTDKGSLTQTEFEKRMLAYSQLNKFLMAFINNILREMQYVIVRRNLVENIMDFEFKEPLNRGYFYADDEKSFKKVIFSGQERKLFVFDLLLFLIVDYFAQNYILAGFIVYIVYKFYNICRDNLGRRNISRKTLVDKRFLI